MTDDLKALASLLTLADIAALTGLTVASVRTYHTDASRRRREGKSLPQDLPAPDAVIVRTPVWTAESIEKWQEARRESAERNAERLRAPRGPRTKVAS